MPECEKTGEQASAATIVAGDEVLGVQSAESVLYTAAQVKTFVDGAGVANTITITGEHLFTEDNELDYSGSLSDGMSAETITFSELPADTRAIYVLYRFTDSGGDVNFAWKRSAGGSLTMNLRSTFADGGAENRIWGVAWLLTDSNTIRVITVTADHTSVFKILGYEIGT